MIKAKDGAEEKMEVRRDIDGYQFFEDDMYEMFITGVHGSMRNFSI